MDLSKLRSAFQPERYLDGFDDPMEPKVFKRMKSAYRKAKMMGDYANQVDWMLSTIERWRMNEEESMPSGMAWEACEEGLLELHHTLKTQQPERAVDYPDFEQKLTSLSILTERVQNHFQEAEHAQRPRMGDDGLRSERRH